jgi:hypothetical protein
MRLSQSVANIGQHNAQTHGETFAAVVRTRNPSFREIQYCKRPLCSALFSYVLLNPTALKSVWVEADIFVLCNFLTVLTFF